MSDSFAQRTRVEEKAHLEWSEHCNRQKWESSMSGKTREAVFASIFALIMLVMFWAGTLAPVP